VKRVRFKAQLTDETGRALDLLYVMVIKVCGKGADFDPAESGIADIFETFENTRLPKASCRQADRPTLRLSGRVSQQVRFIGHVYALSELPGKRNRREQKEQQY
jgi:hypothetical protein